MTISTVITKNIYSGNAIADTFAYAFPIAEQSELAVYVDAGAGLGLQLQVISTDYTVTGAGSPSGGNVVFTNPPPIAAGGNNVVIRRVTLRTQQVDYIEGDTFPANTHEGALDKLTRIVQEQQEEIDRAVKTQINDSTDPQDLIDAIFLAEINTGLDAAATAADRDQTGLDKTATAASASAASTSASNAATSASNAATSASNAATSETNAAASAASIVGDAAAAATSASNAATSETNAANSASAASTSETNAATSATNAATSATNAATSETNAATSEANAAQSAADAAASAQGVPTGSILDFGGSSAPTGFLLCDGSNVNRTTYAALFAAIGVAFGVGDGSTTFGVPDFRRRVAVGSGGTGTGTLANTVGAKGGAETHTLVSGEMPSHTHTQDAHAHISAWASGAGAVAAGPYSAAGTQRGTGYASAGATATNQNTGGDGAHNNMQPSLVVTKIIKT